MGPYNIYVQSRKMKVQREDGEDYSRYGSIARKTLIIFENSAFYARAKFLTASLTGDVVSKPEINHFRGLPKCGIINKQRAALKGTYLLLSFVIPYKKLEISRIKLYVQILIFRNGTLFL